MSQSETTPPAPGHRCPRCDAVLPADTPAGLCPACLISAHFGTEADLSEPAAAGAPTPAPEEIAPHFPQLEILSCLGRGGMGVVYKARQKSLNRLVALKLLAPERGSDPAFAERFAREAQVLARLDHPHIVTIHDFGQAGGYFYLLMEFVDGVTLRHLIHGGRLASREALAIVPQICDALQFAHDHGVVHRDIKPENILLDRRGLVKVADFGLVKLVGPGAEPAVGTGDAAAGSTAEFTEAGKVMGTPRYMAPEQREHPTEVDHRADIYALGVVLYQMLTGELPDERQLQPPSRRVRLDVRLDEIVLRALEQEPSRRYASATEFKTRVETFTTTPPPPPGSPPLPPLPVGTAPYPPPPAPLSPEETRRAALGPLKPAAIALIVTSAVELAGLAIGLVFALGLFFLLPVAGLGAGIIGGVKFWPLPVAGAFAGAMILLIAGWLALNVAADLYVISAARRMLNGRDLKRARIGAIVAIVLGTLGLLTSGGSGVWFLGLWSMLQMGAGIWAFLMLRKPEICAAFDEASQPPVAARPPEPPGSAPSPLAPERRVRRPAMGLMIASGLQLLLLGLALLVYVFWTSYSREGQSGTLAFRLFSLYSYRTTVTPSFGPPLWYSLALSVLGFWFLVSGLVFFAAWRMRRLRNHGLAVTGALLALLTAQGFGLGILFGFWALIVLLRPSVHAAFDEGAPRRRRGSCLLAFGATAGLAVLIGLTFAGLIYAAKSGRRQQLAAYIGSDHPNTPLPAPTASPGFVFGPENKTVLELNSNSALAAPLAPGAGQPLPITVSESTSGVLVQGVDVVFQSVDSGQWDEFTRADTYRELRRFAAFKPDTSTIVSPAQGTLLFASHYGPAGLLKISSTPGENGRLSVALQWKFFRIAPAVTVGPSSPPTAGSLTALGGPLPAVESSAAAAPLPPLPADALDLAPFWAWSFAAGSPDAGYGLRALRGRHDFDGLPFLVGGQLALAGRKMSTRSDGSDLPSEVSIPVGRAFAELHLLHAVHWQDPVGVEVATLRFLYADGQARSVALRYGVHLLDWQRLPGEESEPLSDPASRIVWRGPGTPGWSATARVIATTIANPRPDQPVDRLQFVSSHALASYALVAATVSAADPGREKTPPVPPPEGPRSFTGELRIRIVDARTGEPLAGVLVEPGGTLQDTSLITQPLFTDSAGVARVRYDPAITTTFSVNVRRTGYEDGDASWDSAAALPAEYRLRLKPADPAPSAAEPFPDRERLGALKVSELIALQHDCLARLAGPSAENPAPTDKVPGTPDAAASGTFLAGLLDCSAELARRGACPGFAAPPQEPGLSLAENEPARLRIIMSTALEDALARELEKLGRQSRTGDLPDEPAPPLVRHAAALAAELFRRSGWRGAGLPDAEASPAPAQDIKARLATAAAISNWNDRDKVFASLAMEALRSGDVAQTRDIIRRISSWHIRDESLHEVARTLKKLGRHEEALEFAKTISNWKERDAALVELTR